MKKKEIIWGVLGIILIVMGAFFVANIIHKDKKSTKPVESNALKVDGKAIKFKAYRVDMSFFIKVPDTFVMLSEEELKNEYDYNSRPELVFKTRDNLIHIFITTTDDELLDENVLEYGNNQASSLMNVELITAKGYKKFDKSFFKLEFSDQSDGGLYRNIRFFSLNNKLVTVEFNINKNDYKKWKTVSDKILDSICFNEKDIKK